MFRGYNAIDKKAEMYEMLMALEMDFIENFQEKLCVEDIPKKIVEHAARVESINELYSILHGLDFQSYIEICNSNLLKLQLGIEEKDFLNKDFIKIIPIRNTVMHPRPLGILDYPILQEIFNNIEKYLNGFSWKHVHSSMDKIKNNPDELIAPPINLKKSETIIENLPVIVDYEETSFIGRKKEIGEIKQKLNKNNVHILSVIGDGGIGKTALVIKLLYDMLDDDKCKFQLILWCSLKTSELNKYEFTKIDDSIKNVSGIYEDLASFVAASDCIDVPEYLIELAQNFNTLLVLDNLETINTSEIKEFLDRFTEYGKVIITSRIGLGEMEHRYRLEGLGEEDVKEYINTLLSLYGFEGLLCDSEKYDIAVNQLYSNPLAIKWFVRCLYNGQDISDILANKSELANFCMSNVYDKLSQKARDVLEILIIAGVDLTLGELIYYMDCSLDGFKDVSYAINELIKCNFLDDAIFRTERKLAITSFANEFLKLNFVDTQQLSIEFKRKNDIIQSFNQKILQNKNKSPYAMKSFIFLNDDKNRFIAAYYLYNAIDASNNKSFDKAFELVDIAKKIAPSYFECNKIAAFLYGTTRSLKAKNEYEIAIKCCLTDEEKVTILIVYAGFLLRCNDYQAALEKLNTAEALQPENIYIKFEKVKIMGCINNFDAYKVLENINFNTLDEKNKNIYLTRKADLMKRESETFDQRDVTEKIKMIKKSFETLEESSNPDIEIYKYMAYLLKTLTYLYFDRTALDFIYDMLQKYYTYMSETTNYNDFKMSMRSKIDKIEAVDLRENIYKYVKNTSDILSELGYNEGLVYAIRNDLNCGFFKTSDYPNGIYFKIKEHLSDIKNGDIIKYDKIIRTDRGIMTNELLSYRSVL